MKFLLYHFYDFHLPLVAFLYGKKNQENLLFAVTYQYQVGLLPLFCYQSNKFNKVLFL